MDITRAYCSTLNLQPCSQIKQYCAVRALCSSAVFTVAIAGCDKLSLPRSEDYAEEHFKTNWASSQKSKIFCRFALPAAVARQYCTLLMHSNRQASFSTQLFHIVHVHILWPQRILCRFNPASLPRLEHARQLQQPTG